LILHPREVGVFTAIGTSATAINLGFVAAAVPAGLPPLAANAVGFVISFLWSFFGHARWTFPSQARDVGVALQRFAVVSLSSFGLTEAAYAGALRWTSVDYRLSLFVIIVTLALGKLLASKHWAFASS
jgi:putative flippase GtrA